MYAMRYFACEILNLIVAVSTSYLLRQFGHSRMFWHLRINVSNEIYEESPSNAYVIRTILYK